MKTPFFILSGLFLGIIFFAPANAEQVGDAEKTATGSTVHEVKTFKYKFDPREITIKPGDTIRWVNIEKRQYHSVWFRQAGEDESEYFFPDEIFEKTFEKSGDFPYVCGPHEDSYDMKGIVHVVE